MDEIFPFRILMEQMLMKKKKVYVTFVDLEKAYIIKQQYWMYGRCVVWVEVYQRKLDFARDRKWAVYHISKSVKQLRYIKKNFNEYLLYFL